MQRLRIGLTTVVETEKFTRLPQWDIDFKRQTSVQSVRDLQQGRLDAAIIGIAHRPDAAHPLLLPFTQYLASSSTWVR